MKNWLVVTYKKNELKSLQFNLSNQKFEYYLPRITISKGNSKPQDKLLFPGYIFVNIEFKNYSALKYTKGIKNIVKFGNNISCVSSDEIASMKIIEDASKLDPVTENVKVGQEAVVKAGSLKGIIVKISSLPSKDRVDVLMNFLGSMRKITISERDLKF